MLSDIETIVLIFLTAIVVAAGPGLSLDLAEAVRVFGW